MKLTILKNPFNTANREIHNETHIPGKTIKQYAQPYVMGLDEFVYSCNGKIVEGNHEPFAEDYLAVCPVVGKSNILGAILSIGLSAITGGIWANGGLFGTVGKTFMSGLLASAVGFLGGQLINHLFPQPKMDIMESPTSTPTYGWGGVRSQISQGGALPITYGSMITAGVELAKHITSNGEKQYLNILLCGGEGPCSKIEDIKINDNPIENYSDIILETRLGTNDQHIISNFNDTYDDKVLNYDLDAGKEWTIDQTEGNGVEGLEVTFEFPNGLYHMNDRGSLENALVKIEVQYRRVNETWTNWLNESITDNKNNAIRKVYRKDNIASGQYEVRCRCIEKSGETTRDSTRIYWTQLTSIIYDDFIHPNKILLGIKALATDQLSGSDITVSWKQTVETVNVWNQTKGIYEEKSARNPAWVCYDMLHGCRKLKNINTGSYEYIQFGAISAAQLDYQAFDSWAKHCDYLKLNFEHIFDSATDLWEALKIPESFGRGKVISKGTRFSCVCDQPSEPVQMFTVGNMIEGKFSKEYMSLTDRANAVEITFTNKEKNYQKDAVTIYGEDYNTENAVLNPTQITLNGCTDYKQAWAHGKYLLRINKLMLRNCTWEADIDAIACQIGDQVLLAHDVPEWGYSGRIISATLTELTLDRAVSMEEGKLYSVIIRLQDDTLITKSVVNTREETNIITLTTDLSEQVQPYDLYSFGEVKKEAKPFIVVEIARKSELTATLSGIEYVPAVYEESLDEPVIDYAPSVKIYEVKDLHLAESSYEQKDGTISTSITCTWVLPRGAGNKVYIFYTMDSGKTWIDAGYSVIDKKIISSVKTNMMYRVKACVMSDLGVISKGITKEIFIEGKTWLPSAISYLAAKRDTYDSAKVNLSWTQVIDRDLRGYIIKSNDEKIAEIKGTQYVYTVPQSGKYKFAVFTVDNSGNLSETPAKAVIDVKIEPDIVRDLKIIEHYSELGNGAYGRALELHFITDDPYYRYAEIYMLSDNPALDKIEVPWESMEGTLESLTDSSKVWELVGQAYQDKTITNVEIGRTYTFKIVSVNANGIKSDFDASPIIAKTVTGYTLIPKTPTGLSVIFTDICEVSWNAVSEVSYYELRTNKSIGADEGLVIKTKEAIVKTMLPARKGELFLFACNPNGNSQPVSITYHKEAPPRPKQVEVSATFQKIIVSVNDFIMYMKGINVKANNGEKTDIYFSPNNTLTISALTGIYDIQVAFVDLFGAGDYAAPIHAIIKPQIDSALLKAESISLDKVDTIIKNAVKEAQAQGGINESLTSQIKQTASAITSVVTELNKSAEACKYTAIAQTIDEIQIRAKKENLISLINVCPEAISLKSKLVHISGDTLIDDNVIVGKMLSANAITADKISASVFTLQDKGFSADGLVLDKNGIKITEVSGAYTQFNAKGIIWYSPEGIPSGAIHRIVSGAVSAGKYVRLNWTKKPLIIMSLRSVKIVGNTTSFRYFPSEITKNGFRANLVSSSSNTAYGNLGSSGYLTLFQRVNNYSDAYSGKTPAGTVRATVMMNLLADVSVRPGYFGTYNATINIYRSVNLGAWALVKTVNTSSVGSNFSITDDTAGQGTYQYKAVITEGHWDTANSECRSLKIAFTQISYILSGDAIEEVPVEGEIDFIAFETDGDSYYTVED